LTDDAREKRKGKREKREEPRPRALTGAREFVEKLDFSPAIIP